jgi:hypothetical protein
MSHNRRTCKHCQRYPYHGHVNWLIPLGIGLALELEALRRQRYEHTLSQATRYIFRTHTPAGKIAFVAGWSALTYWFLPHILNYVEKVEEEMEDA